jgi:phage replication O-like protein O
MASPQIENGHTRIANELLEALAFVNFNGEEARLVFALLRKTYGFQKKLDFISNSQFVKATGLYKAHVSRGETRLIERKIVTRIGNKVGINKNYEQWLRKDKVTRIGNSVTRIGNKLLPELVDTKESKETIQKKLPDKSGLSSKKKKEMKNYNEDKHYEESAIDIETGEAVTPSKPKENKNKTAIALVNKFYNECEQHLHIRPAEAKGSYFLALKVLDELPFDSIPLFLKEWFASGKEKADLIQATQCFSINRINRFKANHPS